MRVYVCLFCRQQRTLVRLKPYKNLYSCPQCVKDKGGLDQAVSPESITHAVKAFEAVAR